jgi:molybdopterin-guanine dinucleotide biosynthesis protein A
MKLADISGVILAGGHGSRLGGNDKGLVEVAQQDMIDYVIQRFAPQVGPLYINANRNIDRYRAKGYPIINDTVEGFAGPLAGIAAVLDQCDTPYLATSACDSPFLPEDLVARLVTPLVEADATVSVALGGGRPQPVFAIISTQLRHSLNEYLANGERKIMSWFRQQDLVEVDFGADSSPFANINSPDDLLAATNRLTKP